MVGMSLDMALPDKSTVVRVVQQNAIIQACHCEQASVDGHLCYRSHWQRPAVRKHSPAFEIPPSMLDCVIGISVGCMLRDLLFSPTVAFIPCKLPRQ